MTTSLLELLIAAKKFWDRKILDPKNFGPKKFRHFLFHSLKEAYMPNLSLPLCLEPFEKFLVGVVVLGGLEQLSGPKSLDKIGSVTRTNVAWTNIVGTNVPKTVVFPIL